MELDQRPASDYQVTVRLGRRGAQLESEPLVELEGLAEIPARHDRDGVLGHGLTVLHPSIPQGQDTHQRDEGEELDEVADALELLPSVRHHDRADEGEPDGRCSQYEVAKPPPETGPWTRGDISVRLCRAFQ
jgi:hypothetical protein